MAEKSVLKPLPPPPFTEEVGVVHGIEVVVGGAVVVDISEDCTHMVLGPVLVPLDVLHAKLVVEVTADVKVELDEEEELVRLVEDIGKAFPLREGGIMAGVSSLGTSFFLTLSAMRYMASANCSELSRPFFSMSHRFLVVNHKKGDK